ncbi:MAG: integrase arm-type DNA-binding domain-containing protein [Candidatus Accumulibacter sp.]|jgi:integrase|nr:integrase arm-type DNA-binding domain-containing protein [Accumulibacter sp.]
MALTVAAIRTAKPAAKSFKMADGNGLYLLVRPAGGKLWRMDYRFHGRRKTLSFGVHPEVGLGEARAQRREARKLLRSGADPGALKKARKAAARAHQAHHFACVAREWFERWKADKAESHSRKVIARLERDVLPWIGHTPAAEITAPMTLSVLRRIEARGAVDTAYRVKSSISQVMRYAVATGHATRDPCPDLRGALPPRQGGHFAALTDPRSVGELLRRVEVYEGPPPLTAALKLAPLLFARPGELRSMKWSEIDLERGEWRYFVHKVKTEHLVPLARQAVGILHALRAHTGHGVYVFPAARHGDRPMGNNAVNRALRALGYDTRKEMTGHGFRAMARTLLAEELAQAPEWIEHQLSHRVPDVLGAAYNRTRFLKERRKMMQAWADYLERIRGRIRAPRACPRR